MNDKTDFQNLNFNSLYQKYRLPIAYSSIAVVSLLLLFFVVIPQFRNYFQTRDELNEKRNNVMLMNSSIEYLSSVNDSELNRNLQVVNKALPSEKDFAGILSAISQAASDASVSLGDYGFQVGDLEEAQQRTGTPFLLVNVSIGGGVEGAMRFMESLSQTLPISEVTSVQAQESSSTLTIRFYFKPLTQTKVDPKTQITKLSQENIELLATLSTWETDRISFPLASFEETEGSPSSEID